MKLSKRIIEKANLLNKFDCVHHLMTAGNNIMYVVLPLNDKKHLEFEGRTYRKLPCGFVDNSQLHLVGLAADRWYCDCQWFVTGHPVCSHILAVQQGRGV